jgi:hypothetical protein
MTQDEIIEMAEKTGVAFASDEYSDIWQTYMHVGKKELEAFAKLVAAKEREACAKLCEEKKDYAMPVPCPDGIQGCLVAHYFPVKREKTGSEAAAAIRARGDL